MRPVDIARELSVSRTFVDRAIHRGDIKAHRVKNSKIVLVAREDFQAWREEILQPYAPLKETKS
jgi:excisionase family DNA binding protein